MTHDDDYVPLDTQFSAVESLSRRREHRRQRRIRGAKRFFAYSGGVASIGLTAGLSQIGVAIAHDVPLADAGMAGLWCIIGALIGAFLGMGACSFSLATGVTPWAIYVSSSPGNLDEFDQDAKSVLNAGLIAAVVGATIAAGLGNAADEAAAVSLIASATAGVVTAVIVAVRMHVPTRSTR